ncbi:PQQ-dependent sugar dehydrogenase [Gloeobacter morelensis]|uniref:Sorbosone dehydrogenase family protein n=1 Tax=Gloeobacter morelensis MG652769 TaxID=2781736 RepID=A0ABY3PJ96_9CYAN|nr:sorbosone dehydrogenase family protein [Gloeobacter morelensis]UFP93698.1 sorbosone dehydrogenase family protein [Gloeobacter morelensis MG652769]
MDRVVRPATAFALCLAVSAPAVPFAAAKEMLPQPFATPSVTKRSKAIGWPSGRTPVAPAGFQVSRFAAELDNPRWLYALPNGDVLVAESRTPSYGPSANRITLLRDTNGDGTPEVRSVFLGGLNLPFGMLVLGDSFYVANTDGLLRYPYKSGQLRIDAPGTKIVDLPGTGYNNHWTRNLTASPDGKKIYISVGSATNVDEENIDAKDPRRAAILEVNPDGSGLRVFAGGLRNPVGMDWLPGENGLWTVVNERDHLGDDLVPDYLTRVREGAFYGWPYAYFGPNEDPRQKGKRPDLVAKAVEPDFGLGAHTASLGLAFYRGRTFPATYHGGAFIGQRGSWNRSRFAGYKVLFVPFRNGQPTGPAQDFLSGFIADEARSQVYGRPVGVTTLADGSLLVADDAGNTVWRVAYTGR